MLRNKLWHWNYCYLRFGTKLSHVQIADLDELVAFDFSKYGNVMSAIEKTENVFKLKYGDKLPWFRIEDHRQGVRKFTDIQIDTILSIQFTDIQIANAISSIQFCRYKWFIKSFVFIILQVCFVLTSILGYPSGIKKDSRFSKRKQIK